jgi:hypothetical protein
MKEDKINEIRKHLISECVDSSKPDNINAHGIKYNENGNNLHSNKGEEVVPQEIYVFPSYSLVTSKDNSDNKSAVTAPVRSPRNISDRLKPEIEDDVCSIGNVDANAVDVFDEEGEYKNDITAYGDGVITPLTCIDSVTPSVPMNYSPLVC